MSVMKSERAKEAMAQKLYAAQRDPRLTTAPLFCNASMPVMDKPIQMTSARPGADQHQSIPSRGVRC